MQENILKKHQHIIKMQEHILKMQEDILKRHQHILKMQHIIIDKQLQEISTMQNHGIPTTQSNIIMEYQQRGIPFITKIKQNN